MRFIRTLLASLALLGIQSVTAVESDRLTMENALEFAAKPGSKLCNTACVCLTENDIPSCLVKCKSDFPPATHFIDSIQNNPINPFLANETSTCDKGYAPTPTLKPKQINSDKLEGSPQNKKPNIILFLMDDQDEVTSPYFEAMPFARNLFLEQGTKLNNFFSASSICCAARCQLLTGLMGHNVGVLTNAGDYGGFAAFSHPLKQFDYNTQSADRMKNEQGQCINNELRTFNKMLQEQANYKTALIGKYINGLEDDANGIISHASPGWTRFIIPADHLFYAGYNYTLAAYDSSTNEINSTFYGVSESDYSTDVVSKLAVQFIDDMKSNSNSDPLFMYLASTAPHLPLSAAPRHKAKVAEWDAKFDEIIGTLSGRANYYQANITTKPSWLQSSVKQRDRANNLLKWNRVDFAKRMASLYALDELIQNVHNKISEMGELDNTIFVLTADNGYNLGAQHLIHKMAPYEESIRIPFYMSGAGIPKGQSVDEYSLLIDLAPTFLDLAGLNPPEYLDGHSLMNFINPNNTQEEKLVIAREDILLQYGGYGVAEILGEGIVKEFTADQLSQLPVGFLDDLPPYLGLRSKTHLFVAWHSTPGTNQTLPDSTDLDNQVIHKNSYNHPDVLNELNQHKIVNAIKAIHGHEYELYDLMNDPHELVNLLSVANPSPQNVALAKSMQQRMYQLFSCHGSQCIQPPQQQSAGVKDTHSNNNNINIATF